MEDLVQFAQKVISSISQILPFPISLSDKDGVIIGSTILERIGTIHPPSKEVLKKNTYVVFDENKIKNMENVLPGIAVPLTFDNKTIGVLGIIGPPNKVKPYAQLIKKSVELMWQETVYKQSENLRMQTYETFVQYILFEETPDPVKIKEFCHTFQIQDYKKRFCILIDIGNPGLVEERMRRENIKRQLLEHTCKAFECDTDALCTFLYTEKIVLLKPLSNEKDFLHELKQFEIQAKKLINTFETMSISDIRISAGNWRSRLGEVNHSYREAEKILSFGKISKIKSGIYSYYNWESLLSMLPHYLHDQFQDDVSIRLKPLMENTSFPELARTFIEYCHSNMNISKAAKKLFIHRNTLIYRLQKIEALTSLDTKSFGDSVILYLAIRTVKSKQKSS